MAIQNHKDGQRVFCFSQSMFGGGSKIWGTVKECKKHKWVVLDNSDYDQDRVRYDRAFWYSEDEYNAEMELVSKLRKEEKEKELQTQKESQEKLNTVTEKLVKVIASIGSKVKVVSKYCPDIEFIYEVVAINGDTVMGKDDSGKITSIGKLSGAYYAA